MAVIADRKTIEFELSSSTPEDRKWVKAYERPDMADLAFVQESDATDGPQATYLLLSRLILDWSWFMDAENTEKAPITPEILAKLHPDDLLGISDHLDLSWLERRAMNASKKKNSSATSSPNTDDPAANQ